MLQRTCSSCSYCYSSISWRSIILFLFTIILGEKYTHASIESERGTNFTNGRQLGIEWTPIYPATICSTNVPMDCKFKDKDICCSALQENEKKYSNTPALHEGLVMTGECFTTKEYVPSPYEIRHLLKSKQIAEIEDRSQRHEAVLEYLSSPEEVNAAKKWLARVKVHMHSKDRRRNGRRLDRSPLWRLKSRHKERNISYVHPDDEQYMSKFIVTTTCDKSSISPNTKIEWIEPLSMHARHPFGLFHCSYNGRNYGDAMRRSGVSVEPANMFSLDYILLQKDDSLVTHDDSRKAKSILFDAGTSRFDSSLFWLTCAYSQRRIDFDRIYGWEMSLLNPVDFWEHVPPRWKPRYHFYNKGISINSAMGNDVEVIATNIGITKNDFVSFKLDIDTPSVEVPLALELLNPNSPLGDLVDEFFFELHFRCEIMMPCGWDDRMPEEYMGLKLDRYHALKFFGDMRRRGIRSHFWP